MLSVESLVPDTALVSRPNSLVGRSAVLPKVILVAGMLIVSAFVLLTWESFRNSAYAESMPVDRAVSSRSFVTAGAASPSTAVALAPALSRMPITRELSRSEVSTAIPVSPVRTGSWRAHGPRWVLAPAVAKPALVTAPATIQITDPAASSLASAETALPTVRLETGITEVAAVFRIAIAPRPTFGNQCNNGDNGPGQAVACDIQVTNNLNLGTGATSSEVTVTECHGITGTVLPCATTKTSLPGQLITVVTQCDNSGNGGGGTVTCNVQIVNDITGAASPTGATINQCNDSGGGGGTPPTVVCDPIGNAVTATITQCNESGNDNGATMRVLCTVTASTVVSVIPITVDQCNSSGDEGFGQVTCTVSITNVVIAEPPIGNPPGGGPPAGGTGGSPGGGVTGGGTVGGTQPVLVVVTPLGPTPSAAKAILPEISGPAVASEPAALAFTGSQTTSMTLLGLLAMVLGGLIVLFAGWSTRRGQGGMSSPE
jgi:hypothetical protein